jgi:hypothetical protein
MISCRRHLRYSLSSETRYNATIRLDHKSQSVDIINISSGGTFIGILEPPPAGTQIDLSFKLPEFEESCHIPCVVRWTGARGAGLQFVRLTQTATSGVARVIKTLRVVPSQP